MISREEDEDEVWFLRFAEGCCSSSWVVIGVAAEDVAGGSWYREVAVESELHDADDECCCGGVVGVDDDDDDDVIIVVAL